MYENGASESYVTAVYEFVSDDEHEAEIRTDLVQRINDLAEDTGHEVAIFPGDLLHDIRAVASDWQTNSEERLRKILRLLDEADEPTRLPDMIERGGQAIRLHPDLRPDGIDYETAAADIVTDILHAVFGVDQDILARAHGWPQREPRLSPEQLLERALRHYRDERKRPTASHLAPDEYGVRPDGSVAVFGDDDWDESAEERRLAKEAS